MFAFRERKSNMAIYASKKNKKSKNEENSSNAKKVDLETQKLQETAFISYIDEQLALDKKLLISHFPFTGSMISRLNVVSGCWDDIPTACTNGEKIWINALFYSQLTENERLFVLAHECWHVILRHFLRKMNRNQELWNWATDLEIHFLLTKEGFTAPFVLPHDPSWKDLSFEEIYEKLIEQAKKKTSNDKSKIGKSKKSIVISEDDEDGNSFENDEEKEENEDGLSKLPTEWKNQEKESKNLKKSSNNAGQGFDTHDQNKVPEKSEEDPRELENTISGKIKASSEFAKNRNRGTLPEHIQGIIDNLPKSELSWKKLLRKFLTDTMHGNRTWIPPNRRYVYKGIYRQSAKSQEMFRGVVALDTSGSCTEILPKFFSELSSLLKTFGAYEIEVIQCDCQIQNAETFSNSNPPKNFNQWKGYGFGGTSHIPVFDYINKKYGQNPPNCVICLTDLATAFPKLKPKYPVLWITPNLGDWKMEVPFGSIIQFKN